MREEAQAGFTKVFFDTYHWVIRPKVKSAQYEEIDKITFLYLYDFYVILNYDLCFHVWYTLNDLFADGGITFNWLVYILIIFFHTNKLVVICLIVPSGHVGCCHLVPGCLWMPRSFAVFTFCSAVRFLQLKVRRFALGEGRGVEGGEKTTKKDVFFNMTSFLHFSGRDKGKTRRACTARLRGGEQEMPENRGWREDLYANGLYKLSRACCRDTVYI